MGGEGEGGEEGDGGGGIVGRVNRWLVPCWRRQHGGLDKCCSACQRCTCYTLHVTYVCWQSCAALRCGALVGLFGFLHPGRERRNTVSMRRNPRHTVLSPCSIACNMFSMLTKRTGWGNNRLAARVLRYWAVMSCGLGQSTSYAVKYTVIHRRYEGTSFSVSENASCCSLEHEVIIVSSPVLSGQPLDCSTSKQRTIINYYLFYHTESLPPRVRLRGTSVSGPLSAKPPLW